MADTFSVLCLHALLAAGQLEDFTKGPAIFAASAVIPREDVDTKKVVVTGLVSLGGELKGVIYMFFLPYTRNFKSVYYSTLLNLKNFQSCRLTLSSTDQILFL